MGGELFPPIFLCSRIPPATGFASKVKDPLLEEVGTTCGNGWVNDRRAILLMN